MVVYRNPIRVQVRSRQWILCGGLEALAPLLMGPIGQHVVVEILEFLDDHMLTYRTHEQRRKRLETATQDPLSRAYLYSYGISIYHHRLFAEHSSPVQNRDYLAHVFGRPYSYRDLARSYNGWHRQSTDPIQGY